MQKITSIPNLRTKLAAITTILGLGALGGFALGTNESGSIQTVAAEPAKPKVIRRTVHRVRHMKAAAASAGAGQASAGGVAAAPPPVAPAPPPTAAPTTSQPIISSTSGSTATPATQVSTHTSGGSGSGTSVSTHTSGGGGESEHEGDDGGDD